ncbi:hypothetical protein ACJO5Y_17235 [Marinobacter sp. GN3S48]|uniref:hypothetical protein n=1 Tax=Marinobacter sp. GN3S48 TaxID=3382302 RepID=UPI00387B55A6
MFWVLCFLVVPWHVRVVDVEKNRLPGGTAFTPDLLDASDCSVYSKPSVCATEIPVFRDTQWGTKTKKNPGNNKNNADRQRFQGGFVRTDPPFDYLAQGKSAPGPGLNISCPLFPAIRPQTCANPVQTVKLSFFALAITEFNV